MSGRRHILALIVVAVGVAIISPAVAQDAVEAFYRGKTISMMIGSAPGDGTREDDFPTRVSRAVAGYVRGQILFSLAMGFGAGLGLYLLGVLGIFPDGKTYALGFGAFFRSEFEKWGTVVKAAGIKVE